MVEVELIFKFVIKVIIKYFGSERAVSTCIRIHSKMFITEQLSKVHKKIESIYISELWAEVIQLVKEHFFKRQYHPRAIECCIAKKWGVT